MVNCSGFPEQITPLLVYVGVTVIVADCILVDVLTTENEPISPVPAEGKPIEVFVLVQLYSVTPSVFNVVN